MSHRLGSSRCVRRSRRHQLIMQPRAAGVLLADAHHVPAEFADAGHVLFDEHFHQRLDLVLLARNRLVHLLMHRANRPAGFRIIDAREIEWTWSGLRSGFVHAATPSDVTCRPMRAFSNFGESPDVTSNSLP